MSIEQEAHELNKLREVLEERGILGVIDYCLANPGDTLGAANTALNRGALVTVRGLIDASAQPVEVLTILLRGLADGATLARVIATSEGCPIDPAPRLRIMQALDDSGWRLDGAAQAAFGAAQKVHRG
jgi:hypothetical protein